MTPPGEFVNALVDSDHCRFVGDDLSPIGEESKAETREIARNWHHSSDSGPAEFGISPVKTLDFFLWAEHYSTRRTIGGICPGMPLIISNPEFVRSSRVELEIPSLRLSDYRFDPHGSDGTGVGFFWSVR